MEVLMSHIGLRDIFVITDDSSEDVNNKKTVKERSMKFANNEYKARSSFGWPKQVELKNREIAGMQAVYDEIPSLDSGDSNTILNYLQVLSKNRKKILCFMKGYRHRETKGYLYSNRQITDDYMCQLVLAETSPGAPCALAHNTSTQKRQKARRVFDKSNQANPADDGRRTVIAYGDASLPGMKKRYTPILVKRTQRALAKKAIVIPVDEFRTSITCCKCYRKLDQKYEAQTLVFSLCSKRKRRLRLKGQKNAAMYCLDDDRYVICRTSQCSERMPGNFPPAIYQLKQCKLCPAGNGQDIAWQRDINAAINIRSIMVSYIEAGHKILSRYPSLTRGGAFGVQQPTRSGTSKYSSLQQYRQFLDTANV
ncbi:hypothetical protein BCV71DRAFT_237091 [Rhizopus microsporus]|uniref:Uncharacterized protein n=1 Tax=Rhizopus microsporus TaxID=58291 RepID=A0A1X0RV96_RHIZD|nr:hypothetical protein BCV71DRAFT_237091 [Rhizopus microsporus]